MTADSAREREEFDVAVVGSGFGGAVTAQRLAAAGLSVCVLERGSAYPPGSFARTPEEMRRNLWDPSAGLHGLFDVWSFRGTEAVVASGLGGGSLIYANVLLRKDERWFVTESPLPRGGYEHWPVTRADLDPHYDAVERMLRPQRYPVHLEPYASTPKTQAMQAAAQGLGLDWQLPPLAVTFGNPGGTPTPGEPIPPYEFPNLHGRPRSTCRLCGECDLGCNDGSKNTLDHTYLSAALAAGAELRTGCEVRRVAARHGGGYVVGYVEHRPGDAVPTAALPVTELVADRVVLAAGALGTSYLLLRNRAGLPALSPALGTRFSGNGDLLTFLLRARRPDGGPRPLAGTRGPVITSAIRVPDAVDGEGVGGRGFYVEDAGFPAFAAWMVEANQVPARARRAAVFLAQVAAARLRGSSRSALGAELAALLGSADLSSTSLPLLGMGRDVPDGVLRLRGDCLDVDWTSATSRTYFARMRDTMRDIAQELGGTLADNPIWHLRQRVITVHSLGGAPMGRHAREGVVDSSGEVFGHAGLYVADGAAMPGPVGANPALTIAAFADRVADRMLERRPARSLPVVAQRRPPAAEQLPGRDPDAGAADRQGRRLEFTEEMKGFVALGETDPERGHSLGRRQRTALMFRLTIRIADVDAFVRSRERQGVAVGWVECEALGGRLPVQRGTFNLFVVDPDGPGLRMLYRLHLADGAGNPVTLTGVKHVRDDPGLDVWRDTTTLSVRLLAGHVDADGDPGAPVVGAGVLTIHARDFLTQLTTFRASGPGLDGGVRALGAFGRLFLSELRRVYVDRGRPVVTTGTSGTSEGSPR